MDALKARAALMGAVPGLGLSTIDFANLTQGGGADALKAKANALLSSKLSSLGLPPLDLANLSHRYGFTSAFGGFRTWASSAQSNVTGQSWFAGLNLSIQVSEVQKACLREVDRGLPFRLYAGKHIGVVSGLLILNRLLGHCEPIVRVCTAPLNDEDCVNSARAAYDTFLPVVQSVHEAAVNVNATMEATFIPAAVHPKLEQVVGPVRDSLFFLGSIDLSQLQQVDSCEQVDEVVIAQCDRIKALYHPRIVILFILAVLAAIIPLIGCCCACYCVGCFHVIKCHLGCCFGGCGCGLWPGCCGRECCRKRRPQAAGDADDANIENPEMSSPPKLRSPSAQFVNNRRRQETKESKKDLV